MITVLFAGRRCLLSNCAWIANLAHLDLSWTPLESNLEPLRRLLERLGRLLERLGRLLERLGLLLERLERLLEPTWELLGVSWAQLGRSWAPVGPNLAPLGSSGAQLGRYWVQLAASGEPLGLHLAVPNGSQASLLSSRTHCLPCLRAWPACAPALPARLACRTPSCALYTHLCCSSWPSVQPALPCTPVLAGLPGLSNGMRRSVHPSVLFTLAYSLMRELPFELTQQLPVRTKLHLNFHNSCRFQLYIVASALLRRWISTGAR